MEQGDKRAEEKQKNTIIFWFPFRNRKEWRSKGNFRAEGQIRQGTKLSEENRLNFVERARLILNLCELFGAFGQQGGLSNQVSAEAIRQRGSREQIEKKITRVISRSKCEKEGAETKREVRGEKQAGPIFILKAILFPYSLVKESRKLPRSATLQKMASQY